MTLSTSFNKVPPVPPEKASLPGPISTIYFEGRRFSTPPSGLLYQVSWAYLLTNFTLPRLGLIRSQKEGSLAIWHWHTYAQALIMVKHQLFPFIPDPWGVAGEGQSQGLAGLWFWDGQVLWPTPAAAFDVKHHHCGYFWGLNAWCFMNIFKSLVKEGWWFLVTMKKLRITNSLWSVKIYNDERW